ncbi:MAG TPA: translation initiation factor [Candidatus Thermoplasmatota archaeon]|nr:translation initiation factor [Candidatus Thermoplasmatota archaeon]
MALMCDVCGLPKEICVCEEIAREQQEITIYTVARRYGKMVTIVDGIDSGDIDITSLCSELKAACACGGTEKGGKIELQGDHKQRVKQVLERMGFNAELR